MALLPAGDHPHGFSDQAFDAMFTADTDVVFATTSWWKHFGAPAAYRRRVLTWQQMLDRDHDYVRENFEDRPEVRDWTWTP